MLRDSQQNVNACKPISASSQGFQMQKPDGDNSALRQKLLWALLTIPGLILQIRFSQRDWLVGSCCWYKKVFVVTAAIAYKVESGKVSIIRLSRSWKGKKLTAPRQQLPSQDHWSWNHSLESSGWSWVKQDVEKIQPQDWVHSWVLTGFCPYRENTLKAVQIKVSLVED